MTEGIKQLNKEKYQLDIKIEMFANEFLSISQINEALKQKQEELRIKEKNLSSYINLESKDIQNKNNDIIKNNKNNIVINKQLGENSSPGIKNNNINFCEGNNQPEDIILSNDPKVQELKEENQALELTSNTKIEYMKQLKDQIKTNKYEHEQLIYLLQELQNLEIENNGIEKDIVVLEKEVDKLENKEFSECIDVYSKYKDTQLKLERTIELLRVNLEKTNQKIKSVESSIDEIESSKVNLDNDLALEFLKKKEFEFNLEKVQSNIDDVKTLIQNCEYEIERLSERVIANKEYLETLELELQHIYYFIKYSNSLINSIFNIVNTRRIQIELVCKFDMNPSTMSKEAFAKLDDMEQELFSEYYSILNSFKADVNMGLIKD